MLYIAKSVTTDHGIWPERHGIKYFPSPGSDDDRAWFLEHPHRAYRASRGSKFKDRPGRQKRRRSRERKENLIPVRRQALTAAAASAGRVMQIARRPAATRAILTVTAGFSGRRRGGSVRSTKPQPPRPARQGHGRGSGSPKLMIFGLSSAPVTDAA